MSANPRPTLIRQAAARLSRPQLGLAGALLLGLLGGALEVRKPSDAAIVCVAIVSVVALATLGDRAFPWAIVMVAVAPWYPFIAEAAEPPIVRQKVLCAAIAAAPLAPWLWSLALGDRRTRPSRSTLLMGVLFAGLTILIYETLGNISSMIESGVVGYLFAGVTFLCARRFSQGQAWLAAAFGGLLILCLLGAAAYIQDPSNRIGYFVGYPITYGALVVGLLPAGMLYAYRRSRLLAGALAGTAGTLLIFSESRSSWVASTAVVIVVVVVQARAGNFRALGAVAAVVVVLAGLIASTGSLQHIVEQKLSSKVLTSQSVTHRQWSYSYALETIGNRPIFGAGAPGFSARESASKTTIGAIDNGYVSITVDLGLFGLVAAMIPIAVAFWALGRCLRYRVTPAYELALALGIIGMAFVALFYDSFYWAQIDLLLGGLGGVLSARAGGIGEAASPRRRVARARRRRVRFTLAS
ncbi:MAG TPA: O-antigen ligase family protein [Solirubrobacteraceae bacterium]